MTVTGLPVFTPAPPWPQSAHDRHAGAEPARAVLPGGYPVWLVGRYNHAQKAARSRVLSRAAAIAPGRHRPGFEAFAENSITGTDGAEHRRYRDLAGRALTPQRVSALRPRVTAIAAEIMRDFAAGPQPADLASGFCRLLPVRVICELLGVPDADAPLFSGWADAIISDPRDGGDDRILSALADMDAYMVSALTERLAHPRRDLLTAMARAAAAAGMPPEKACTVADALYIGGVESIATVSALAVLMLLENPGEMDRLRGSPGLAPQAAEEVLRYHRMAATVPPILPRVTTAPVRLGSTVIPAGDTVLILYASANRDPAAFADPDRFDILRQAPPHLAFGRGDHFCPGSALARTELDVALHALVRYLPGLALAADPADLRFTPAMGINALRKLPVTWEAP